MTRIMFETPRIVGDAAFAASLRHTAKSCALRSLARVLDAEQAGMNPSSLADLRREAALWLSLASDAVLEEANEANG